MPGPAFLDGEQVTLNIIGEDDVPFLYETINDPAVNDGLGFSRPKSEEIEREWVESVTDSESNDVHFLICVDGESVGTTGLNDVSMHNGTGEIGYYLTPEAWGHGYATAAVRRLVTYAFDELRLHRVYAQVFAENEGSRRVLEKAGFEHEGILREHWYRHGAYEDVHRYGVLESEWEYDTERRDS